MNWSSAVRKQTQRAVAQAAPKIIPRAEIETENVDWERLVTLDFETYYDSDYTLSKLSTSEYVRDPRFKAQMVGIKIGRKKTKVVLHKNIAAELKKINWATHSVLCHNVQFDGFILSHRYGIVPARYYDTLGMARGLHSNEIGAGLDEVAKFYGGQGKIDGALEKTKGVLDWSKTMIAETSVYCANDVDETFRIFCEMHAKYPAKEMDLIHMTARMFCAPVLQVDIPRVQVEYEREVQRREELLLTLLDPRDYDDVLTGQDKKLEGKERDVRITKKVVGSNERFVQLFTDMGIAREALPRKISPAWMKKSAPEREEAIDSKWSFAFAKDDLEFLAMPEQVWSYFPDLDPNHDGHVLVAAAHSAKLQQLIDTRIAVKSTTNITRAERFLKAGAGGMPLPVGYAYYRAHCVPGDTEVLTRGGWVRLDAWGGGEIAQVRPDQSMEFLPATRFEGPVESEWLQVRAPYVNCDFTLGHTMPYFTQKGRLWTTEKAGNLANRNSFDVPIGGRLLGSGAITPEQMRVLVMVQADGSFETDSSIGRRMGVFVKKSRKIERARQLLTVAGVLFKEQSYPSHPGMVRFIVRHADYPAWLTPERKFFGPWLLDSTEESREAFLDELQHWDGYRNHAGGLCYSSSDEVNAEWAVTLAHLCGRSASTYRAQAKGRRRANHTVSFRERAFARIGKNDKHLVHTPIKTFCASTQTGFWLARSGGRIFVTGNTGRFGGNNKMNMQNLTRGGELRLSILAAKGHAIAVADSGQIEARVNGWLWGQNDLLDAFRHKRDVYSEFATAVYGRTITKNNETERHVGKVCLAEGELVLTHRGEVPINLISLEDRLWDGVEWVSHGGLIDQGIQEVITYDGLTATPDHEVFTECGRVLPLWQAASEMARLQRTGAGGKNLRFCDDHVVADTPRKRLSVRQGPMRPDWYYQADVAQQLEAREDNIVPQERAPADASCGSSGAALRRDLGAMRRPGAQVLGELRRAGDQAPVQDEDGGHTVGVDAPSAPELQGCGDRQGRQQRALRPGEFAIGHTNGAEPEQAQHANDPLARAASPAPRVPEPLQQELDVSALSQRTDGRTDLRKVRVYDIADAGPRRRFTASGKLVFNCVLGLGYQMGALKLQLTLAKGALGGPPIAMSFDQCQHIVSTYRRAYYKIQQGWKMCSEIIEQMAAGIDGEYKCLSWGDDDGVGYINLPNGMRLKYPDLRKAVGEKGWDEWSYQSGAIRKKIYGGLLCENLVQALARIIVMDQMLMIDKKYPVVMTTHDEVVAHPKLRAAQQCYDYMHQCMVTAPWWCPDIPLAAEGGWAANYSK